MRKIVMLCLIVALGLGVTGATCLQNVQTTVCNAPADVVNQIQAVMSLAEMAVGALVPGSAPYVAAVGAYATASAIQSGICVSITQLNNLIAFLQNPETQALSVKMMRKTGPIKATAISVQPFINWRDKAIQ